MYYDGDNEANEHSESTGKERKCPQRYGNKTLCSTCAPHFSKTLRAGMRQGIVAVHSKGLAMSDYLVTRHVVGMLETYLNRVAANFCRICDKTLECF